MTGDLLLKLLNSINPVNPGAPELEEGAVVTIGNFDGCHKGHQSLIQKTLSVARGAGLKSVALSFEPHPGVFFGGKSGDRALFTRAQKIRAFQEYGFDALLIQTFDRDFCGLSPDEFFDIILTRSLKSQGLIIGHDFRYGFKRQGDPVTLLARAKQSGIRCDIQEADCHKSEPVSSTRIRNALKTGDMQLITGMLGRPYLLEGLVVPGKQLGRKLGFPTMNLEIEGQILPDNGVYACYAWVEGYSDGHEPTVTKLPGNIFPAVMNIGTRATIPEFGEKLMVEVHILNQQFGTDSLYQRRVGISVVEFLRKDLKFETLDQLKEQISRDTQESAKVLQSDPGASAAWKSKCKP